jgi:tripartite-type tricarboxylate transporter receptor subunit TctC
MKKFLAILLLVPILAFAWEPTKPVTVIIGFQPGSGNEVGFRVVSAEVQRAHPNVNFIIELKPGADSVIASNMLYEAKPDGYTISIPSYMGTFVTNDIWQRDIKKWQYNDFSYVMGMGKSPLCIVANPKSKVNTIAELVQLVQTTDHPITFAVGGGAHRMTFEYFMYRAAGNKAQVKTVQYPGPLQAVTSVASEAGTEFGIMPVAIAKPLIDAGKVRLLGITGDKRLPQLPNTENIRVAGSTINVFAAWAMILPPNTPKEIVQWYQTVFNDALKTAEVKRYYENNLMYIEPSELTPDGLMKHVEHLRSIWMPLSQHVNLLD